MVYDQKSSNTFKKEFKNSMAIANLYKNNLKAMVKSTQYRVPKMYQPLCMDFRK